VTHETRRAGRAFTGELSVRTSQRSELLDITAEVGKAVASSGITSGVCHLYVPHTTAGVVVNEHDDPAVARDIETVLDRLVPHSEHYEHLEGNADAHAKAAIIGTSTTVFVDRGRLDLGRWQGIFFCEFDGPRQRRVRVKVVPDPSE
jgi:secondary thiamine-phosphate synthase enzyme